MRWAETMTVITELRVDDRRFSVLAVALVFGASCSMLYDIKSKKLRMFEMPRGLQHLDGPAGFAEKHFAYARDAPWV